MSEQDGKPHTAVRRALDPGRWDATPVHAYKDEGSAPFRDVTRQILFADPSLSAELRYFEVARGGWSTLERHEHVHAVMVHRGHGRCLVGREIRDIGVGDLVFIPPMTWHQFRAATDAPLGFLCMVNAERDRPQLPTDDDIAALKEDAAIAAFLAAR
jgi:mannose-6-phosphate isomerase-like protein (cupin superfamily)